MRVVLDTNVWLDWLVFDGNEVTALRAACAGNAVQPVIDSPCLNELARVLAYPEFKLDAGGIDQRLAEVRALSVAHAGNGAPANGTLPRCTDPDDQKFLELAQASGARALLSRDKALLRLGRRTRRRCGFDILAPRDWVAQS